MSAVTGYEKLVAFGSWRCNCTQIARTLEEIPDRCTTHDKGLLGPKSWERNQNNVPFGVSPDHRCAS